MLRAVHCDKALKVRSLPALGSSVPHFSVNGIVHIPAARALCVGGSLFFVPLMPKHSSIDAWRAWAASVQMHLPAPLDAVLGPVVWIRLDENGSGAYCDLELHMWQAALERLHPPSHSAAQVRTLLGYERNKAAAKCKRVVGNAEGNASAHASGSADAKAVPKAAKKPIPKKSAKAAESEEDSSDGTYVQSDSESDSRTESSEDASCASDTLSDSEGSVSAASSEDAAGSESNESNESSSDSDDSDDSEDGARAQKTRSCKSAAGRSCSKPL